MTRSQARHTIRALIVRFRLDIQRLRDPLEGLRDLDHLDIDASSHSAVSELEARVLRRIDLLGSCIDLLQGLLADGYPEDVRTEGGEAIKRDFADQIRTISSAAALFETLPAVELNLTYSEPERK